MVEVPTNKVPTVRAVAEAFPSVVCPTTVSVPSEESDEVAMITPPVVVPTVSVLIDALVAVRFVKTAFMAFRKVENKLVELLFVMNPFTANRLVVDAEVKIEEEAIREEIKACELCRLTMVPEETVRSVIDVVASLLIPATYKLVPTLNAPVVDASFVAKWDDTLRLAIVDEEMVVVASVVLPRTTKGPVEVEPVGLERKFKFSVQADPFQ